MATQKKQFQADDKSIQSRWVIDNNKITQGPSQGSITITSSIALPVDATNIKATFCCTLVGRSAFSTVRINKTTVKKDAVSVSITGIKKSHKTISATVTCKAATSSKTDGDGQHVASLSITKPYFELSWTGSQYYDPDIENAFKKFQRQDGLFPNMGQVAFIYDKTAGQFLFFDGITKLQFSNQVSIQDKASNQKKKDNYVNNCKDEPDEITMQVIESNVYTNVSKFEGSAGTAGDNENTETRAAATYMYLYELKQDRRRVDVYTKLMYFQDFMIKSISLVLDENTTDGWTGNIVLHEYIAADGTSTNSGLGGTDTDERSDARKKADAAGIPFISTFLKGK